LPPKVGVNGGGMQYLAPQTLRSGDEVQGTTHSDKLTNHWPTT
jgi:hypothetical protein